MGGGMKDGRKRKVTNNSRAWEKTFVGHSSKSEIVDLSLEFLRDTEKAIQVTEDGGKTTQWLPKSQIEYDLKEDGSVEVQLPRWLYEEKGFIA